MTGALTLSAALVLGVTASGHCMVMCGGISAALGIATAKNADGAPQLLLLVGYQLGRILSYSFAGLLLGGILGSAIRWLDVETVRRSLRALSAMAFLIAALIAFGRMRDPSFAIGHRLWSKLAPVGRRLLPVSNLPRSMAFGMIWGWMPCGFVYTVLLIASLQGNAAQSSETMLAFGLGTTPAMFATAAGARRLVRLGASPNGKRIAGTVLLLCATITLAGPWLIGSAPWLHAWLPFDCTAAR
jgi:sulfite exporter TauE/SafE